MGVRRGLIKIQKRNWCMRTVSQKHRHYKRNWDSLRGKINMQSCAVLSQCRWIIALECDLCTAQQNAGYPREALGLVSVNTGWQLEQKVELQSEFTSGPAMPAARYSGEREGGGNRGEWWDRPWGAVVSLTHHAHGAEIRSEMMQGGKRVTARTPCEGQCAGGYLHPPKSYWPKNEVTKIR